MAEEQINNFLATDRFKLGKKWFWIGMVVALFSVAAGLLFGIALLTEKDHRKEGLIIVIFALVWAAVSMFVIAPLLIKSGFLSNYTLMKFK